jgi:hypothetical protein
MASQKRRGNPWNRTGVKKLLNGFVPLRAGKSPKGPDRTVHSCCTAGLEQCQHDGDQKRDAQCKLAMQRPRAIWYADFRTEMLGHKLRIESMAAILYGTASTGRTRDIAPKSF